MQSTPTAAAPAKGARPVKGYACLQQASATQSKPRPPSRTTSLPFKQAKDLVNALAFSEAQLLKDTPWAHVIVVLDQSEYCVADPRAYTALQGRILRRIRDWLRSQDLPAHFLWVREIGPRYGQQHTHIILPLPKDRRDELNNLIRRTGRLHDTPGNRAVVIRAGMPSRASRAGVLMDFLKTMSPKARLHGVPIMPVLGIDNRGQKPCTIFGKRSGTSESLNRKARAAAGWRELETLPELRSVLTDIVEQARKKRNREKQRRYRARKAAGIAPMPSKPTSPLPRSPDPFDVSDLAADFFD